MNLFDAHAPVRAESRNLLQGLGCRRRLKVIMVASAPGSYTR
jgi:hypothetical protein